MTEVTVYSSADAGAPQFTDGKPSELFDVLRACLIDGYNDKAPAGWQLQSMSETELIINNDTETASGFTARLTTERGDNSPKQCVTVTPMASWTGTEALMPGYSKIIYIASDTNFFQWTLIASKSAFYFFKGWSSGKVGGDYQYGAKETAIFVGDIKPIVKNDLSIFLAYGADGGKQNHTFGSRYSNESYDFGLDMGLGGASSKTVMLYDRALNGPPIDYAIEPMKINANPAAPILPTDGIFLPVYIMNDIGTSQCIRGTMPGLIHPTEGMHKEELAPLYHSINGQRHYAVTTIQNSVGLYINCEQW